MKNDFENTLLEPRKEDSPTTKATRHFLTLKEEAELRTYYQELKAVIKYAKESVGGSIQNKNEKLQQKYIRIYTTLEIELLELENTYPELFLPETLSIDQKVHRAREVLRQKKHQ